MIPTFLAGVYGKLIAAGLLLAALAALWLWGDVHGAHRVQAQWDTAKSAQTAAAAVQRADSAQQTLTWTQQFTQTAAHYEALTHETTPTVADATAAAVDAGTLRLPAGPAQTCPAGTAVSVATARSRAADAAATQTLADRVKNSIAAVRAGDDADARERQLGAQVDALQALLVAERAHPH